MLANRVDVLGTDITFSGRSDVNQAVAGLIRLQQCAVLGISDIKLSEDIGTVLLRPQTSCKSREQFTSLWTDFHDL